MFRKYSLLTVAVLSLFIIAACNNAPAQPQENQESSENQQAATGEATQPEDSAFNEQYAQDAIKNRDATMCESVTDEQMKAECIAAVSDYKVYDQAVQARDESKCETIANQEIKEQCNTEASRMTPEESEQAMKDDNEKNSALVASKNYAGCKNLSLRSSQVDCEVNILMNMAIAAESDADCAKGSDQEIQDKCRAGYEAASGN